MALFAKLALSEKVCNEPKFFLPHFMNLSRIFILDIDKPIKFSHTEINLKLYRELPWISPFKIWICDASESRSVCYLLTASNSGGSSRHVKLGENNMHRGERYSCLLAAHCTLRYYIAQTRPMPPLTPFKCNTPCWLQDSQLPNFWLRPHEASSKRFSVVRHLKDRDAECRIFL